MKPSFYNIFIPTESSMFILYNTLKDTILLVDDELKEALEASTSVTIPKEHQAILKKAGMLVGDDIQEKSIYQYMFNSTKYNASGTYFVVLTTYACNLNCPYCYEKAGTVLSHAMDEKTSENVSLFMKTMVKENKSCHTLLKLYGGEPLLNVDACFTICDALSDLSHKNNTGFYIVLQTNGTLLNEEIVERLSEHLFTVEMTLEGDKDYHDTIRTYKKGGGTYEDIMNAVGILLSENVHVSLRINASEPEHLDALLKDMKKRGLQDENLTFYVTQTSDFGLNQFFTDDILCLHDEKRAIDLIPELRTVVDTNGFRQNLLTYDTLQRQKILPCNSEKRGRYVIDPFGDVYLCFFTAGQKEFRAGTIEQGGTIQWDSNFYDVMLRSPLQFAECRECRLLPMCGGGCHIRAYKQNGTYLAPHCGSTKELAEERIKLYLQQKYPERFGGLR
jgi:uncharacterized protein